MVGRSSFSYRSISRIAFRLIARCGGLIDAWTLASRAAVDNSLIKSDARYPHHQTWQHHFDHRQRPSIEKLHGIIHLLPYGKGTDGNRSTRRPLLNRGTTAPSAIDSR
jgi:hypothetical protein